MKLLKWILFALLTILILAFISVGLSIHRFSSYSLAENTDAAIVLGAAVWDAVPSPVFEERINHAINLYLDKKVKYLIFTGGVGIKDDQSEAEIGKNYAINNGVSPEHIFIESDSRITYQNLVNAKDLSADLGINTFLIVSDPLHMKRSVTMAENLGMLAYPSPTPTTKYVSWRSKLPFLIRETFFFITYQARRAIGVWQ